ncbi:hypothetical protein QUW57_08985, partial [Phocaeicola plebeius]|uniref:hypothetical protein n=1 Tax=Phocaeicola plebeius TaxID=310297 RepID=UPI0021ABE61A
CFRAFFVCTPASVSAAGRFFFLLPDSFLPFFFPLLSFVPLPLTRTAFRNASGDVFSEKENHSLSEAPDALRTGESSLRRETCFGKHGSESSGL